MADRHICPECDQLLREGAWICSNCGHHMPSARLEVDPYCFYMVDTNLHLKLRLTNLIESKLENISVEATAGNRCFLNPSKKPDKKRLFPRKTAGFIRSIRPAADEAGDLTITFYVSFKMEGCWNAFCGSWTVPVLSKGDLSNVSVINKHFGNVLQIHGEAKVVDGGLQYISETGRVTQFHTDTELITFIRSNHKANFQEVLLEYHEPAVQRLEEQDARPTVRIHPPERPSVSAASLTVILDGVKRNICLYSKPGLVLGRNRADDVALRLFDEKGQVDIETTRRISRHHWELSHNGHEFSLWDRGPEGEGSTSGTVLAGEFLEPGTKKTLDAVARFGVSSAIELDFEAFSEQKPLGADVLEAFREMALASHFFNSSGAAWEGKLEACRLRRVDSLARREEYIYIIKQALIGRGDRNCIAVDSEEIDDPHARLVFHCGHYFLEDLDSSRGTFVNGSRLKEKEFVALGYGDTIQLGGIELRFGQLQQLYL